MCSAVGNRKSLFNISLWASIFDWGTTEEALISGGFGGCEIKNNLLNSNAGADYPYIFIYHPQTTNCWAYSRAELNSTFTQCSGNIDLDPQFSDSPGPSPYPYTENWWQLATGSPCIDAGIVVVDGNAAIGGWEQLNYNDSAPDIGAYEGSWGPRPPVIHIKP